LEARGCWWWWTVSVRRPLSDRRRGLCCLSFLSKINTRAIPSPRHPISLAFIRELTQWGSELLFWREKRKEKKAENRSAAAHAVEPAVIGGRQP
jgi:hypothetical protein